MSAPVSAPGAEGARLPRRDFGPITMTDIVRYQGASGDMNPMHHDDELARSAGYPAAFSVGMLGAGYLATYCTELYGVESVRRFRTRFRAVIYRGETLHARGQIVRVFEQDGERRVEIELQARNDAGAVVIDASAEFACDVAAP